MKYISKNIQKYLTKEQIKEYKSLCKQRNMFTKNSMPESVTMYNRWSQRRWEGTPTRHHVYYIEDKGKQKDWRNYFNKIKSFCNKISSIEMFALEEKEKIICKPGNVLKYISTRNCGFYRKSERFILQEKTDRDHYTLIAIGENSSLQRSIWKWKWLVTSLDLEIKIEA